MSTTCPLPEALAAPPATRSRLPLASLVTLAAASFVTILTEALPAGLLPRIAAGLGVTEAQAGQLLTVYALGSIAAAIPLTAATRGLPRRQVLVGAVAGFAVANTVTALSASFALTLAARFAAGVAAGLLWALLAGYAIRMVAPDQSGRALAIAMAGAPLAMSLGIPLGTLLGDAAGWRVPFLALSAAALLLVALLPRLVPAFPGEPRERRVGVRTVAATPGLAAVLAAMAAFVLGHNILYTYVAPLLERLGEGDRVGPLLLLFGFASVGGLVLAGAHVDRRLRPVALALTALFAAAVAALGVAGGSVVVLLAALVVWGVAFGAAGTLFQGASAVVAGEHADVAQAMVATCWNIAIAGGALLGGVAIDARRGRAAVGGARLRAGRAGDRRARPPAGHPLRALERQLRSRGEDRRTTFQGVRDAAAEAHPDLRAGRRRRAGGGGRRRDRAGDRRRRRPTAQAGRRVDRGRARDDGAVQRIPQRGAVLGDPDAPVTVVEFADLQCPYCKIASDTVVPEIVERYVRNGDAKLVFRDVAFIGDDSLRAGQLAAAAGETGPHVAVHPPLLRQPGRREQRLRDRRVPPDRSRAGSTASTSRRRSRPAASASYQAEVDEARQQWQQLFGSQPGTPAFAVGRGEQPPTALPSGVTADDIGAAIERAR